MDGTGASHDFRNRFEQSKVAESKREALIQDLIDENDRLAQAYRKMALDLESETEGRRRLQGRIHSLQSRRSFVLVLIDADGDGYIFRDNFLNKNEEGGKQAADELLVQVRKYVGELGLDMTKTDVVVRAYANLRGLGRHCARDGLMKATADLGLFANGFTKRQPLFDFVDVGLGKERADDKVRETLSFFINNEQCKHVLLGVAHDSGYAPFLERFVADDLVQGRLTMLQGYQVNPIIRELGFTRTVRFPSVFAWSTVSNSQRNMIQHQPTGSKQANRAGKGPHASGAVDPDRLGPVMKNQDGQRIDRPLAVDSDVMQAMKKKNLCVWLFLRGRCDGCPRNHAHPPLSAEERDALCMVGRQGMCFTHRKGKLCEDPLCVYGHGSWLQPDRAGAPPEGPNMKDERYSHNGYEVER
ncbi:MAG: hypothetical protein Q9177_001572 [Variospora cf. flavescens]